MGKLCVKVDLDLCQGHGVCQAESPALFELQETDAPYPQAIVLIEKPGEDYREQVLRAEKFCPNSAITVSES